MTNEELTKKLGKSRSYFSTMKRMNKAKYEYISSFDDDLFKSIGKFEKYITDVKGLIKEWYYSDIPQEDKTKLANAYFVHFSYFENVLFTCNDNLSHSMSVINKLIKLKEEIEKCLKS